MLDLTGPLDLAVIGGGISGLYTAWKAQGDRPDRSVALFEMPGRTGAPKGGCIIHPPGQRAAG